MIFVDDRTGSKDLTPQLRDIGLAVEMIRMESADVAFEGKGTAGRPVDIGIELKKLGDLVSSIRTGRLAGEQLPKMVGPRGAYDHAWVLVEGTWKADSYGRVLEHHKHGWQLLPGGMSVSELEKTLLTFELCAGVHVRHSPNRQTSLQFIAALYHWWSDVSLDKHTSHLAVHTPTTFLSVSDFCAAVMKWPGIGLRTAVAVEAYFHGSITDAAAARAEEWSRIEVKGDKGKTRRIGIVVASRIYDFCHGK